MINQLWGPIVNLTGDGGFKAFSHAWLFIKASNLIEVALVVVLFVVGMFVNLPEHRRSGAATADAPPPATAASPGTAERS